MSRDLFVDVETTGLPLKRSAPFSDVDNWPRIVSIAWIIREDRKELEERYYILKPVGFNIPASATAIHGISHSQALVSGSPTRAILQYLESQVASANISRVIAHNLSFDLPTVLCEMHRFGVSSAMHNLQKYCTMENFGKRFGKPYTKLSDAHRELTGEVFAGAHEALSDVRACMRCFDALQETSQRSVIVSSHTAPAPAKPCPNRLLIDRILQWAESKPYFDTIFVEAMDARLRERGDLTINQSAALERIASRWNIW
jgi:DNA polymerase III epsilon subunit-like protein